MCMTNVHVQIIICISTITAYHQEDIIRKGRDCGMHVRVGHIIRKGRDCGMHVYMHVRVIGHVRSAWIDSNVTSAYWHMRF